ncbi:NAD(P)-binding protein [Bimuria novae-zelandiae CBS 107.79]|uniref:NAD(P)-binding protein n=1 Tax=Bimuria novae-zelandiae CBS 107.79 TaxID=1447943 RepID=A0A6A5V2S1_9PLEO|nr:NAD(P)-binding protein [Bimuria novae-zelandiae CBS 107.79]
MSSPFPSPTKKWHSTAYPSISPTRPELSQKGKTVLITGGGTGIGAATAHSFAQAGASRIALLGRRTQPLEDTKASIQKQYPDVEVFIASVDVTKTEQVNAAFESFAPLSSGKKIDVVVSNAAVTGPFSGFLEVTDEEYLDGVMTNITMAWNVARAFIPRAAPDATAIDVSSNAAHVNYADAFASYTVGKWANVRLWQIVQFNNPGFAVYSTQPGVVDTDMNRRVGGVKAMGYEDHVSLPADFNVWLASPEARFLKGKFLWTSWDVDELKAQAKEIEETRRFRVEMVGYPFGAASDVLALPEDSPWKSK